MNDVSRPSPYFFPIYTSGNVTLVGVQVDPDNIFQSRIGFGYYGYYGGINFTGGAINGTNYDVAPINLFDGAYRTHDIGFRDAVTTYDYIIANRRLVETIGTLQGDPSYGSLPFADRMFASGAYYYFQAKNGQLQGKILEAAIDGYSYRTEFVRNSAREAEVSSRYNAFEYDVPNSAASRGEAPNSVIDPRTEFVRNSGRDAGVPSRSNVFEYGYPDLGSSNTGLGDGISSVAPSFADRFSPFNSNFPTDRFGSWTPLNGASNPTDPLIANGILPDYSFLNGMLFNTQSGQMAFGFPDGFSGTTMDWSIDFANNNIGTIDFSGLNQTAWTPWYSSSANYFTPTNFADWDGVGTGFTLDNVPTTALPVVLDLTGAGINITELGSSGQFVDMTGSGYQNRTAWAGAGNGVLVLDLNGNGAIDSPSEFEFTGWDPTATSDMQAASRDGAQSNPGPGSLFSRDFAPLHAGLRTRQICNSVPPPRLACRRFPPRHSGMRPLAQDRNPSVLSLWIPGSREDARPGMTISTVFASPS